jgi:hypothetical protein
MIVINRHGRAITRVDASHRRVLAFDDEDHPVAALTLERVRSDARVRRCGWFEVRNTFIVRERRGPRRKGTLQPSKLSLRPRSRVSRMRLIESSA